MRSVEEQGVAHHQRSRVGCIFGLEKRQTDGYLAAHGRLQHQRVEQRLKGVAALGPRAVIIGTEGIVGFLVGSGEHHGTNLLLGHQFVGHRIYAANLEPALGRVVLSGYQADYHGLAFSCRTVGGRAVVEVVTDRSELLVAQPHIVVGIRRMVADAGLEAFRRRKIHVLRVGHRRSVNYIIIGESLVEVLVQFGRPNAVAVALHGARSSEHLGSQHDLFGIGCLEAEEHAVVVEFGRDDGLGEESRHHAGRELRFLARGGRSRGTGFHGLLGSLRTEEQRQGFAEEILGIHPGMSVFVVCEFLHRADSLLVEESHIVAGIAVEEVVGAHAEPEQSDFAVRVGGIVVDAGDVG